MVIAISKGRPVHVQAEEGARIARDRQLFGNAYIEVLDPASNLATALREVLGLGPETAVGVRCDPRDILMSKTMGRLVVSARP